MKKTLIGISILTFLLLTITPVFAPPNTLLGAVEAETLATTNGWGETISYHGGNYGGYATACQGGDGCLVSDTVANGGDGDDVATYTFTWSKGAAQYIVIHHLDGIADDSFTLEAKHANGDWVFLYHVGQSQYAYSDVDSTETWTLSTFSLTSPSGDSLVAKGRRTLEIRITLTGLHWSGYNTWGQLAIDYIALYGSGPS